MAQYSKRTWVKAVEQKCAECIYDPDSGRGTWREQVAACTDTRCAIYPVRPLPHGHRHAFNDDEPEIFDWVAEKQREARQTVAS